MNAEDLFVDVVKNKYGYYELKTRVAEEELGSFYRNCYYQNEMATYRKKYTKEELENKYTRLERMLHVAEKRIPSKGRKKTLLDIGCGEGFALNYFMSKGFDVTGIEYDVHGCEYHNPDAAKKVIRGDACSVLKNTFEKGSFCGIILADNVLEHVLEPERLIEEITAVSGPDVSLIITVPNDFSRTQLRLWEKGCIESPFWVTSSCPPEHLSYFSRDSLERLLAAYGWKMEFIMGSFPIDFNLFNKDTDYVSCKEKGQRCYQTAMEIERLISKTKEGEILIDIYAGLGEAGLGRNLTAYFNLK